MLLGPANRPTLPHPPHETQGIRGILDYINELDQALNTYISTLVVDTFGLIGVRGLSSSGTPAQNLVKHSLAIGGATSATWSFDNIELDTSYLLLYGPSRTTGMVLTAYAKQTTGVVFTFRPDVPSGMLLDCVLLR